MRSYPEAASASWDPGGGEDGTTDLSLDNVSTKTSTESHPSVTRPRQTWVQPRRLRLPVSANTEV